MSYSENRVVQENDAWTANDHDQIKLNFEANPPHVITAKGQLPIATGANTISALTLGTQNQMLVSESARTTGRRWTNSGLVPIGGILIWSGSVVSIPTDWQICDGTNGTPNLKDKFIVGSGNSYTTGDTGGNSTLNLQHNHDVPIITDASVNHTHTLGDTSIDGAHSHNISGNTAESPDEFTYYDVAGALTSFPKYFHTHTVSGSTTSSGAHKHSNQNTVGGGAHTHDISAGSSTNNGLSTTQSILPPYYALCYIQRLT